MMALPSLLVFAKEPAPGAVKTRLAADIGAERAAAVYRELTTLTLAHASEARDARIVGSVEIWCTPDPASEWFRALAADHRATLHAQVGGDLGARMAAALASALAHAPSALVVGTDCPMLDADYLARAGAMLRNHDAVIGPAEDGGYVLVGGNRTLPFANVRWSTPHALADTTAGFALAGIRCGTLPVSWDVDDAAGLQRFAALRPGR